MATTLKNVEDVVFTKLGTASALFMSNPEPGTKQIMPAQALEVLGNEIIESVRKYGVSQRQNEIQEADARLKDEFGEDWLEFRDVRLGELHNASKQAKSD